jgi:hypothetical protein
MAQYTSYTKDLYTSLVIHTKKIRDLKTLEAESI